MNRQCEPFRNRLAVIERKELDRDTELRRHLESCDECLELAESLFQLDQAFAQLGEIDAPDTTVERLLANEALQASPPSNRANKPGLGSFLASRSRVSSPYRLAIAASVVMSLGVGTLFLIIRRVDKPSAREPEIAIVGGGGDRVAQLDEQTQRNLETRGYVTANTPSLDDDRGGLDSRFEQEPLKERASNEELQRQRMQSPPPPSATALPEQIAKLQKRIAPKEESRESESKGKTGLASVQSKSNAADTPVGTFDNLSRVAPTKADFNDAGAEQHAGSASGEGTAVGGLLEQDRMLDEASTSAGMAGRRAGKDGQEQDLLQGELASARDRSRLITENSRTTPSRQVEQANKPSAIAESEEAPADALETYRSDGTTRDRLTERLRDAYEQFTQSRTATQGLSFQPKTGYWRNTYLPGDPNYRFLEQRLRRLASDPQATRLSSFSLHQRIARVNQPFDPAARGALSVALSSDHVAISGRTRTLVQIGLQGALSQGARRESMQIALVVDLRTVPETADAAKIRSLVLHLAKAREPGDRFQLIMVTPDETTILDSAAFRYGAASVLLDSKLSSNRAPSIDEASTTSLGDVLESTLTGLSAGNQGLGSSVVLLVSPALSERDSNELSRIAHYGALAGTLTSVASLGDEASEHAVERLVLAGQGQRYALDDTTQAESAIERVLTSASRTIARAVRVNIRLTESTQLVRVVGSERLDAAQADRVRESERSLDARLAKELGIAADRGEDDDGIQMVLPVFVAGDQHVILLDVVASEPGLIAEVTVRYKDLLTQTNRDQRAVLSLARGDGGGGALAWNVVKNLLAHELSQALQQSADSLNRENQEDATRTLRDMKHLLEGFAVAEPQAASDVELRRDIQVLDSYLTALQSNISPTEREFLTASLRYAGQSKLSAPAMSISSHE